MRVVTAVLALSFAMVGFALAQDDPELRAEDQETMESCLESAVGSGTRPEACVGSVQEPCVEDSGGATPELVECSAREHAFWDALLNQAYQRLRQDGSEEQGVALRDVQRAWMDWREARCAYEVVEFEGGTMANVIANQCFMEETARRAIDLAQQSIDEDRFRLTLAE